jgi:hypothetical protein
MCALTNGSLTDQISVSVNGDVLRSKVVQDNLIEFDQLRVGFNHGYLESYISTKQPPRNPQNYPLQHRQSQTSSSVQAVSGKKIMPL